VSSYATVKARIASTNPIPKYKGFRFGPEVMHGLAEHLRVADVPMTFDHDPSHPVRGRVLDAEVVPLGDGNVAVEVTYEVEESDWTAVQRAFAEAGVPGGFSYTFSSPDVMSQPDRAGDVVLAVDAAGWTDRQREEARALIDARAPTDSELLFQFSAIVDIAAVFVILSEVGIGVLGNAVYDALKGLVRARAPEGHTRVEIHRSAPDGGTWKATVVTNDPEVVQRALEQLPEAQPQPVIVFDDNSWSWPDDL
jgi:hypothetical protein